VTFWTYILECADGSYYVGHTDDLDHRMAAHQDGIGSAYTAKRRPLRLIWATDFQDRDGAFFLERQLKGWSRAKKEAFMGGDWSALPALAKSHTASPRAQAEPVEAFPTTLRQAQGERKESGQTKC
jgi:predicted GIY-YIG superfamily endonuclease